MPQVDARQCVGRNVFSLALMSCSAVIVECLAMSICIAFEFDDSTTGGQEIGEQSSLCVGENFV